MPELPEVETMCRELAPNVANEKITECKVLRPDIIGYPSPRKFCSSIAGEKIIRVMRRAKYLIFKLSHKKNLVFHMRLSGTISLKSLDTKPERFTRLILKLTNFNLFFNEPRVLGRTYLLSDNNRKLPKGLHSLGYEPISDNFDYNYLRSKIRGKKAPIKSLLLDQRICAGVGNIYSDEALFRAGIRPVKRAYRTTSKETRRLVIALKDVLNIAIQYLGTSVSDYVRPDGRSGRFQDLLYVYGREDEPCRICNTLIKIVKLGNRSTRYCPVCQK